MKIKIKIENLVLHGHSYHNYRRIQSAIECEFNKLVSENGLTKDHLRECEITDINTGSFITRVNMDPEIVGTMIARSIYSSWTSSITNTGTADVLSDSFTSNPSSSY